MPEHILDTMVIIVESQRHLNLSYNVLINPATIIAMLGQNVSIAMIPNPTGLGFRSSVKPNADKAMTISSGPLPKTNMIKPIQKSLDTFLYLL